MEMMIRIKTKTKPMTRISALREWEMMSIWQN